MIISEIYCFSTNWWTNNLMNRTFLSEIIHLEGIVPASAYKKMRISRVKLDTKDPVRVASYFSKLFKSHNLLFSWIIINSDCSVFTCCCEQSTIRWVINSKDLRVSVFGRFHMMDTLACCHVPMPYRPVSLTCDKHIHCFALISLRTPPHCSHWHFIDHTMNVTMSTEFEGALSGFQVVDTNVAITISCSNIGIIRIKLNAVYSCVTFWDSKSMLEWSIWILRNGESHVFLLNSR